MKCRNERGRFTEGYRRDLDMEMIKNLYLNGKSIENIAKQMNCNFATIYKRLKDMDIPLRLKGFQSMEKNVKWAGGKYQDNLGYVHIYKPEHPMANSSDYVLEHRLIMSEYLGRILERQEVVHHKNGNVTDNKIENLELISSNNKHMQQHHAKNREQSLKIKAILKLYQEGIGTIEITKMLNIGAGVASYHIKQAGMARSLTEAQRLRRKRESK